MVLWKRLSFFLVLLFAVTTGYGQQACVYDENRLLHLLTDNSLIARQDSLQLYTVGQQRIKIFMEYHKIVSRGCYSPDGFRKAEAQLLKLRNEIETGIEFIQTIVPAFDSIVRGANSRQLAAFAKENDLVIASSATVLWYSDDVVELTESLPEMLIKTNTYGEAVAAYRAWFVGEVKRLGLVGWVELF